MVSAGVLIYKLIMLSKIWNTKQPFMALHDSAFYGSTWLGLLWLYMTISSMFYTYPTYSIFLIIIFLLFL